HKSTAISIISVSKIGASITIEVAGNNMRGKLVFRILRSEPEGTIPVAQVHVDRAGTGVYDRQIKLAIAIEIGGCQSRRNIGQSQLPCRSECAIAVTEENTNRL